MTGRTRCMGIDYGTVRIGMPSVIRWDYGHRRGDHPGETKRPEEAFERILELIEAYEIGTVVVGLPRRTIDAKANPRERHGHWPPGWKNVWMCR